MSVEITRFALLTCECGNTAKAPAYADTDGDGRPTIDFVWPEGWDYKLCKACSESKTFTYKVDGREFRYQARYLKPEVLLERHGGPDIFVISPGYRSEIITKNSTGMFDLTNHVAFITAKKTPEQA